MFETNVRAKSCESRRNAGESSSKKLARSCETSKIPPECSRPRCGRNLGLEHSGGILEVKRYFALLALSACLLATGCNTGSRPQHVARTAKYRFTYKIPPECS